MPEWLAPTLGFAGLAIGAILTYLGTHRKTASEGAQALIDQLQEELATYREAADARATAQDERMNRLEAHVDGYRTYAHELRSHIFELKGPPAPQWPEGLPR